MYDDSCLHDWFILFYIPLDRNIEMQGQSKREVWSQASPQFRQKADAPPQPPNKVPLFARNHHIRGLWASFNVRHAPIFRWQWDSNLQSFRTLHGFSIERYRHSLSWKVFGSSRQRFVVAKIWHENSWSRRQYVVSTIRLIHYSSHRHFVAGNLHDVFIVVY